MESQSKGHYLCFDTETSGLPIMKGFSQYYPPRETEYYDTSRIVELGYIIYNENHEKIKEVDKLVIPVNFTIPEEVVKVHGITNENARENGIKIEEVLNIFEEDLKDVKVIIAHNLNFDYNVVISECYRLNKFSLIKLINEKDKHCTMLFGKKALKLKKNPKLINLYQDLLEEPFEQNHRALDDCVHCGKCYFVIITKYKDQLNLQEEVQIEEYVLQFGKYKGQTFIQVYFSDQDYCNWVLKQDVCCGNIYEFKKRLIQYQQKQQQQQQSAKKKKIKQLNVNSLEFDFEKLNLGSEQKVFEKKQP